MRKIIFEYMIKMTCEPSQDYLNPGRLFFFLTNFIYRTITLYICNIKCKDKFSLEPIQIS